MKQQQQHRALCKGIKLSRLDGKKGCFFTEMNGSGLRFQTYRAYTFHVNWVNNDYFDDYKLPGIPLPKFLSISHHSVENWHCKLDPPIPFKH